MEAFWIHRLGDFETLRKSYLDQITIVSDAGETYKYTYINPSDFTATFPTRQSRLLSQDYMCMKTVLQTSEHIMDTLSCETATEEKVMALHSKIRSSLTTADLFRNSMSTKIKSFLNIAVPVDTGGIGYCTNFLVGIDQATCT